jgi:cytochrome P450
VLRLYPLGWMIPRTVVGDDVIGGRRVRGGSTVLISPYLTHRMAEFWDRPEEFDPERFAPERDQRRHRFAYFPFGGGGHVCLGSHLFTVEAQLVIAAVLAKFRPSVVDAAQIKPQASASLRPSEPVELVLRPVVRPKRGAARRAVRGAAGTSKPTKPKRR